MRAAFSPGPRRIELREVPAPVPAAGEVVVRVRNCGVCGSDLHWYLGAFPAPPVCPGHEIAGEVIAADAGVVNCGIGDRVAVEPLVVCRECAYCRTGDYQLCPHFAVLGTMRDGGFAEQVVVPAYALYRLPAELDFEVGALTEPTAVCVHAVRLARVSLGDRVLILGAGAIGLLSVLAARAAGATDIAITARHAHQGAMARRLGATRVFAATPPGQGELMDFASANPVDVVVETVGGSADTLNEAIASVRPGGTVAVLGVFTTPPACAALALVLKEVRLVGSLTYGRKGSRADFDVAMGILAAHREVVRDLITHRFALGAIANAFETAADKTRGAIKVTVAP